MAQHSQCLTALTPQTPWKFGSLFAALQSPSVSWVEVGLSHSVVLGGSSPVCGRSEVVLTSLVVLGGSNPACMEVSSPVTASPLTFSVLG
jgi:hypothetical protein